MKGDTSSEHTFDSEHLLRVTTRSNLTHSRKVEAGSLDHPPRKCNGGGKRVLVCQDFQPSGQVHCEQKIISPCTLNTIVWQKRWLQGLYRVPSGSLWASSSTAKTYRRQPLTFCKQSSWLAGHRQKFESRNHLTRDWFCLGCE